MAISPYPWTVDDTLVVRDANGCHVAIVCVTGVDAETAKDNAALIAKAPEVIADMMNSVLGAEPEKPEPKEEDPAEKTS